MKEGKPKAKGWGYVGRGGGRSLRGRALGGRGRREGTEGQCVCGQGKRAPPGRRAGHTSAGLHCRPQAAALLWRTQSGKRRVWAVERGSESLKGRGRRIRGERAAER